MVFYIVVSQEGDGGGPDDDREPAYGLSLIHIFRRITGSNALGRPLLMTESKDLWENWVGDLGFLDGTRGDGSRE